MLQLQIRSSIIRRPLCACDCVHAQVTMRLIAERLLPPVGENATYVDRELVSQAQTSLPRPAAHYHVYCSSLNPGAYALMEELAERYEFSVTKMAATRTTIGRRSSTFYRRTGAGETSKHSLHITTDKANLPLCDHVLLYLNSRTWSRGDESDALASEIEEAIKLHRLLQRQFGKNMAHLLLAHEMRGPGGQEERGGCDFDSFFSNPNGSTPAKLLKLKIYSQIAVPLKGGPFRNTSMVLLSAALGARAAPSNGKVGTDIFDGISPISIVEAATNITRQLVSAGTANSSKLSGVRNVWSRKLRLPARLNVSVRRQRGVVAVSATKLPSGASDTQGSIDDVPSI